MYGVLFMQIAEAAGSGILLSMQRRLHEQCKVNRTLTPMLAGCAQGVLSAADAERAMEVGVDGVVVSNHGGRQLDGVLCKACFISSACCMVPSILRRIHSQQASLLQLLPWEAG